MGAKPVSNTQIRRHMEAFERALQKSETPEGRVDMPKLRAEVRKASRSVALSEVLVRSLDVLENRFARSTRASCGGTTKTPPATLSAKEVKSVFAAMIEAKSKGLDKIDADKNGKISDHEAAEAGGRKMSDRLAAAAATGAIAASPKTQVYDTGYSSNTSSNVSAGCGGTSSNVSAGC